ncbi:MAG: UvrD-helicase domain-containing protein [Clostridia bacterium]|nr:UvrD-helicase domain-containing protein [Clostridia bacterium]
MSDLKQQYLKAKKQILEREFSRMNEMQRQAVFHVRGPLLILAGAGSGKTTVLINRIANLIRYGNAYENDTLPYGFTEDDAAFLTRFAADTLAEKSEDDKRRAVRLIADRPPAAWRIMAITFTNKAAGELKDRLAAMLGEEGDQVWASTFHATCARMLRRYGSLLGFSARFTIYDTDDSKRMMKDVMSYLRIDEKTFPVKMILGEISRAKEQLLTPKEYEAKAGNDFRLKKVAECYTLYQKRLKDADAMDFDDLLFQTVLLFQQYPDALDYYRNRFEYIMIDEYQDTNRAQYLFAKLLSESSGNLCVVGDDDQSIYKFRGATIENILSFEKTFPDAQVIRLEQNYRSTQNVLDAANAVIQNNTERKGKRLWTDNGEGDKVVHYHAQSERDEAAFIARTVETNVANGMRYGDHAVLYRMNAQSNTIENFFVRAGIPYRVIGGHRFYERKEIKDMLAYLCVIANPADEIRLKRIINEPKRGIGDKSVQTASDIASQLGLTLFEVIREADSYQALARGAKNLMDFAAMIQSLSDLADTATLSELFETLLQKTDYLNYLRKTDEKAEERTENINELASNLLKYQQEHGDDAELGAFLEEVSLLTDIDNLDSDSDAVVMMTMHSAKGLEFPAVFLPGMEEGIFPGMQSILNPAEIEEERRLAYVGLTRAKQKLYLINADTRMLYGYTHHNELSRFVEEIPATLLEEVSPEVKKLPVENMPHKKQRTHIADMPQLAGAAEQKLSQTQADSYSPGERVRHKVFKDGTIVSVTPMGNDALLEIDFDTKGRKKVMANYAGVKKI